MVKRRTPPRICDAPGCPMEVRRGILMCRPHWFALPRILREAISEAWKDKRISDWSAACLQARAWHADRQRTPVTVSAERSAELQRRLLGERDDIEQEPA